MWKTFMKDGPRRCLHRPENTTATLTDTLLLSAKPGTGTDKKQFSETLNTAHIHIVHVALKEQAVR
jgi:hypothetical protein